MADARPTFPLPQRYTQRKTEAVQPPDDRTYSAEVTVFQRNLPHHRSTRIVSLHTLDYDTTYFFICQEQFQIFSQIFLGNFVHSDGVKKVHKMHSIAVTDTPSPLTNKANYNKKSPVPFPDFSPVGERRKPP